MNDSIRITYVEADSVVNTLNGSEGAAANNHNNRSNTVSPYFLPIWSLLTVCYIIALIVDVRDNHEFVAGHITGAFHLPSSQWVEPTIVEDFLTENLPRYDTFVFHCQKSQSRGPNCARMCAQALENYTRTRDLPRETLPKMWATCWRNSAICYNKISVS